MISFGGLWLGITGLAYGSPHFEHFEVYRMCTHYMALIFISSTILRKNIDTYILSGLSVISIWVSYTERGTLPAVGLGPDLDDYVASTGFILLSMLVSGTLISRSARLLNSAREEAHISKQQTLALKEANEMLQTNQRELTVLRDYLNAIIESMPSVLISVDESHVVSQWNREAQRVTGISAAHAVGRTLAELVPQFIEQDSMVSEAIANNKVVTGEPKQMAATIDGTVVSAYQATTVYPIKSPQLVGAVIRLDDVTDQIHMQELLVHSEKMMSVGGLAAGMAHEINNPLGGILQNAAVLRNRLTEKLPVNTRAAVEAGIDFDLLQDYLQKREITKMIGMITESGKRAAEIVHNMLSFSRKNNSKKVPVRLCDLVKDALELAQTEYDLNKHYDFKKIHLDVECISCPPTLCETSKIQQVLLNIFRNGAEAMHDANRDDGGGRVPAFRIRVEADQQDKWVSVTIEDNGPGIDESVRKRVFEPFFTTKEVGKGTGLGLSISYFIVVENHGGKMEVRSQKGKGTTFIIRLPVFHASNASHFAAMPKKLE
ncbi:MAG: PAS domain-containing protein [Deltaproteobacteria bacterium]|nr:PAS domain-containing protein [Deltaproteobacteria bacterium]MBN2673019.1 PAS domain-containing protein [Deltaproteobacteria bacterium]